MTVEKWNNLTPEQRHEADELLKQARFGEFEEYLEAHNQSRTERNDTEEKDVLLQSEEHNPER